VAMTSMIDKIDSDIICFLQKDGRMPYTKIAEELGLSEATVRTRIQRLLKDEAISIVAVCEPRKLGFAFSGNIKLQVSTNRMEEVIKELKKLRGIIYIALMTGSSDIDADFVVKTLDDLHVLLHDKIGKIKGILRAETSIITSYEKEVYDFGTGLSVDPCMD
jgi:Lrp/AsnC family transcriptional regulator, regulator for asnA, asnC and gidA